MPKENKKSEKGFVKLIILIVVGLLALEFIFDVNISKFISSEKFYAFIQSLWNFIVIVWDLLVSLLTKLINWLKDLF